MKQLNIVLLSIGIIGLLSLTVLNCSHTKEIKIDTTLSEYEKNIVRDRGIKQDLKKFIEQGVDEWVEGLIKAGKEVTLTKLVIHMDEIYATKTNESIITGSVEEIYLTDSKRKVIITFTRQDLFLMKPTSGKWDILRVMSIRPLTLTEVEHIEEADGGADGRPTE